MLKRRGLLVVLLSFLLLGMISSRNATAESFPNTDHSKRVFFTQRDDVLSFNVPPPLGDGDGTGIQVGTVTGTINGRIFAGTSIVNFKFSFPDPNDITTITFENRAIITDLNGFQILFDNVGDGRFINSLDPTVFEIGGPLRGTYEAINASDKYSGLIGRTLCYRAVASNPPSASGFLGTVFVEVHDAKDGGKCDD